MTVTAGQIQRARALLGWSRIRLAGRVGVGEQSIAIPEEGIRLPQKFDLDRARAALEAAGVEFIAENGGGAGVRMRKVGTRAD
jgi:transcriptional regulator with XRE-family HTH domain